MDEEAVLGALEGHEEVKEYRFGAAIPEVLVLSWKGHSPQSCEDLTTWSTYDRWVHDR